MSYAIHPYAISIEKLKRIVGSGKPGIANKVKEKFGEEFEEIDEFDVEITLMEQAIEDLVNGYDLDEDAGFKYGYLLKYLCELYGQMLTNEYWSSIRIDWLDSVDEALAGIAIDEETFHASTHLIGRGAPIELPKIYDFPSIGYLKESEIVKAAMELTEEKSMQIEDEECRDSVNEVRKWFDHCVRKHEDLICFYH